MPPAGIQTAQPALRFIPPAYSPWLHRLCRWLLPLLLRSRGLVRFEASGSERLAGLVADAQAGRIRLLIAFRHPSTTDPLVMAQLLWREVPRVARRHGVALAGPVHSQFLYDRGIPLWAGAAAGWMLAKLGGIPIQRGKLDRLALRTARALVATGPFPLAIAPEGATNNLGELLSPLEPGLAQMAFWCCEDLAAAQRDARVVIVPIGLRYVSRSQDWAPIDRLLGELERQLGLPSEAAPIEAMARHRYNRLLGLAEGLLLALESFYAQNDGTTPAQAVDRTPSGDVPARLARLREVALGQAETHFGLRPRGTIGERCRRIEQAGWERIYRDDLEGLTPVERGLADWTAAEADLQMGHMRLAEPFASFDGTYVAERPSIDRYGEVLRIFWRALAWIRDREDGPAAGLGPWTVRVRVGEPISVDARLGAYRLDRRGAVETLTADLSRSLQEAIPGERSGAQRASDRLGTSSA